MDPKLFSRTLGAALAAAFAAALAAAGAWLIVARPRERIGDAARAQGVKRRAKFVFEVLAHTAHVQ